MFFNSFILIWKIFTDFLSRMIEDDIDLFEFEWAEIRETALQRFLQQKKTNKTTLIFQGSVNIFYEVKKMSYLQENQWGLIQ